MSKLMNTIRLLIKAPQPVDHTETDKMVAKAVANSKVTVKKIEAFNSHLERTQTYFIAKAMGRIQ